MWIVCFKCIKNRESKREFYEKRERGKKEEERAVNREKTEKKNIEQLIINAAIVDRTVAIEDRATNNGYVFSG